jgi:hypothetical protein
MSAPRAATSHNSLMKEKINNLLSTSVHLGFLLHANKPNPQHMGLVAAGWWPHWELPQCLSSVVCAREGEGLGESGGPSPAPR